MNLSHRIRLDPTAAQKEFLLRCAGTARFTWNWALAEAKRVYGETKKSARLADLKKRWNQEKPAWVYVVPKDCNQQPFADLQKAYSAFFAGLKVGRKVGHPRFKKRGVHDGFYLSNDKASLSTGRLRIPHGGEIRLTEALRWQGKVMSYRIIRQAAHWYVSVAVDVGDYTKPRVGDGVVGVDLGLTHLATTSTGEVIDNPRPLRVALRKLARAQRVMSRRVKGSVRRGKARAKVARVHARVSAIRKDVLHKVTTRLCRENQAIGIEDLCVKGMMKNRKLSRAIGDAGWGEFRRQLTYKAIIYGCRLVAADRFYPSSKLCSSRGHKVEEMSLAVREWRCPSCGAEHDRDHNAALNLRALALLPSVRGEVTLVDSRASGPRKSRGVS